MAGERWRVWSARVAVVVAAAAVAASLHWLWAFANTDNPAIIERSDVALTANAACALLRDQTSAMAVATSAPISQRVGAINAQNDAVVQLVTTMRRLGEQRLESDVPAPRWLDDWQRLVQVRDGYARSLARGRPRPMVLPTIDGRSLADRINNVGLNCRVPLALLAP